MSVVRDRIITVGAVTLSASVLSWPLLWNRYPLLYWDTAQYLTRFPSATPSLDRPIAYSAVLSTFALLPRGLVICALVQAVITSTLLLLTLRSFVAPGRTTAAFLTATVIIAVSPNAFHVVTLMPDVATLWMGLGTVLATQGSRPVVSTLSITFALLVHHSNLAILIIAMPVLLLAGVRLRLVLPAVAIATAALVVANVTAGLPPFTSPTSLFLAGRLNQTTALLESLGRCKSERCARWAAELTPLRREPEAFLWDPRSPLRRDFPAWDTNVAQFIEARVFLDPIVSDALRHSWSDFLASGKHNVGSMVVGEYLLMGYVAHSPSHSPVATALDARNRSAYSHSRQAQSDLPTTRFSAATAAWMRILYPLSTITALAAFMAGVTLAVNRWRRRPAPWIGAVAILSSLFLTNVLACAFLAAPQTRYAERVLAFPLLAAVGAIACIRQVSPCRPDP